VMTMARQRVDRVPADQFNHAVTCIRNADGFLILLDPTWMPKSRDNWSTLEPQQHVVYGLPEGGGLAQSPDFPPEANQAHWRATSVIDVHGALRGQLEFTANGAPETRLRRGLAALPPDQRNELFEEAFARLSPLARVSEILYTDPVDFRDAIRIACRYEVDGFVLGHSDRRRLALPMLRAVFGERIQRPVRPYVYRRTEVRASAARHAAGGVRGEHYSAAGVDGDQDTGSDRGRWPRGEFKFRGQVLAGAPRICLPIGG